MVVRVPSAPAGEEDVELRSVVGDGGEVHLDVTVGDQQLSVTDLGLELSGGRRGSDVVGLELSEVVECSFLTHQVLEQQEHRGTVAGLAGRGVLQLALELVSEQIVQDCGAGDAVGLAMNER